jgi:four helix bundle protein
VAKGDDIQARLVNLGVNVMALCDKLPQTNAGKHFAGQLLRSGTSAAPNYAEARGAESASDFIHKLGVVLKELNETEIWLETIGQRDLLPADRIQPVHQECGELCKIIAVSRRTARGQKETN